MNRVLKNLALWRSKGSLLSAARATLSGKNTGPQIFWDSWRTAWFFLIGWILIANLGTQLFAATPIRFDMFLGYDNVLPQYGWYPVTFEIQNDGPGFVGEVEVSRELYSSSPNRRYRVELPTGTTKRLQIPVFSTSPQPREIHTRLLDSKGAILAEASRPVRARSPWSGTLMATLTRRPAVVPAFPAIPNGGLRDRPQVARLIPDHVPDSPLLWESIQTFYLSSEMAAELKVPQVDALMTWIHGGGHLVVNVVHVGDLAAVPWLSRILPALPGSTLEAKACERLHHYSVFNWPEWPANATTPSESEEDALHPSVLRPESSFTNSTLTLYELKPGTYKQPSVFDGHPLLATKPQGRGAVTLLAFNAEQEPFVSWPHRKWFWATVAGCREQVLRTINAYGYRTTDNLAGLLIDTSQIRKLPVAWLMMILIAYLIVIGPLDRWLLKRMKREILTWITFPSYVVIFSAVIYWIGYYLRAGDTEWNELQIVDVPSSAAARQTRVHSFGSIYSPAHRTFGFQNVASPAGFRFELQGAYGNGTDPSEPGVVNQFGPGFRADIPIPIWSSRLYSQDTWMTNPPSISIKSGLASGNRKWTIDNQLGTPLLHGLLTIQGNLYRTPEIPKGKSEFTFSDLQSLGELGIALKARAQEMLPMLDRRGNVFGSEGEIGRPSLEAIGFVMTFSRLLNLEPSSGSNDPKFLSPAGLDMNLDINRGDIVLLAWAEGFHAIPKMNTFQPLREKDFTLIRITVPSAIEPSP